MRSNEFYMADGFDREATMYFSSPDVEDRVIKGTAASNVVSLSDDWCNVSTAAQGTSSDTYTISASDCLCSTIDCLNASVGKVSINIETLAKSLKELGKRVGLNINDSGAIVGDSFWKQKMNLKYGLGSRLKRAELKTLKER